MLKSSGLFRAFNLLGSKAVQSRDVSGSWERGCDLLIILGNEVAIHFLILEFRPNLVGASRLAGINRGSKANQKQRNILNE